MSLQTAQSQWVANANMHTDADEHWVLDYYLQFYHGENGEKLYGLRIDKSSPSGVLHEQEETLAITENQEEILILAKAFARGSVPPVTLLELTDEWHSEVNLLPA
ncbi:MAG: DUF6514 family protein [Defluviitaleaceae bacterium]|nr:DUF6514 family protein [Defluviitaleaceae bacterium]